MRQRFRRTYLRTSLPAVLAALASSAILAPITALAASETRPHGGLADPPAPAPVPVAVDAEVTLIHASNEADGGIDPRIGKLPNLGSYKSYKLLSKSDMTIKKSPTTTTLPNGRILQISLKDVKDKQYIIDTSINQPGGTAFLPLLEVRASTGVPVFIAGQSYQGGMLIIAIKILPK
ncbi:MAG: hypothetical protein ABW133_24960 [Polyangiaceae bacterium]